MRKLVFIFCLFSVSAQGQFIPGVVASAAAGASTLLNDLIVYYDFEESSGDLLDLVGSQNGTLINSPTQDTTGKVDSCYYFTRADDESVSLGTSFTDMGTDDWTAAFWINVDNEDVSANGIVGCWGTYPYWAILASTSSGDGIIRMALNAADENIYAYSTSADFLSDEWAHVVAVYDRDGNMSIYINSSASGTPVSISAHSAVDISNSNKMSIGQYGNDLADYEINGFIDELGIWNRTLTEGEISELYNSGNGATYPF